MERYGEPLEMVIHDPECTCFSCYQETSLPYIDEIDVKKAMKNIGDRLDSGDFKIIGGDL